MIYDQRAPEMTPLLPTNPYAATKAGAGSFILDSVLGVLTSRAPCI